MVGTAEVVIRSTAERVLDLVMDPERYRAVDPRIQRIAWVRRSPDGRETVFRFSPRLGPVPAVAPSTQRVVLDPGRGVRIIPEPSWTDALVRFEGALTCDPVDGGVLVRRRLEFWLAPPVRRLLGGALRRWLADDVPRELAALRGVLEPGAPTPHAGDEGGPQQEVADTPRPGADGGRRGLQVALAVVAGAPLASGSIGMLVGPAALPRVTGTVPASLDSQYRFTHAHLFALAPVIWSTLPRVETEATVLRMALGATFVGGVAWLLAWRASGGPHPVLVAATALELVGAPVLLAWQQHVARVHRDSWQ